MKKNFVFVRFYLRMVFACCAPFAAVIQAQDFKAVQDGIEYAELTREIDRTPVRMNLLRLDLTKVRLDVVHAMDAAIGLEKTSSIAQRHGAFAAINAGFFRIDKSIWEGDNVSTLMINGRLLSEGSDKRVALVIGNKTDVTQIGIERLKSSGFLEVSRGMENWVWSKGINRQRGQDDFVIYTPEFHQTTLTDNNGTEIIVRRSKVVKISEGKGSNLIPSDGFIISLSGSFINSLRYLKKIGKKIKYSSEGITEVASESNMPKGFRTEDIDIVSGVPQLIKNGKIEITWQEEKAGKSFVETKHPRTAVAKLRDGKFLMVTVDGRSAESVGMNLYELAAFLLEMGATDAMNLDGGGSTTMFLNGKIVNRPSDKEGERRVGDAILVFPRKK